MTKGKLIIHFDGLDEYEAMRFVESVVKGGRISKTHAGPQYCFVSVWDDGTDEVNVYAYRYKSGTDVFKVIKTRKQ